jgi:calcium-dependent protein kinase
VQKGVYKISGPIWSRVSQDGIDLVKKMLTFDPERRITAQNALLHTWIQNNTESMQIEDAQHSEAMKNLHSFNAQNKLQSAALTFMTTHMISTEEMRELQKTFETLDTTKDGKLSREELIEGYSKIMGSVSAELEVNRIME